MSGDIRLQRVYDPVSREDGIRVLVDGLWPRGIRKDDARVGRWMRPLAPSPELRRWFHHDPSARWERFRACYREELAANPGPLTELVDLCRQSTVTLVFAARDRTRNQAVVLREVLLEELAAGHAADEPASPTCWMGDFPEYSGWS